MVGSFGLRPSPEIIVKEMPDGGCAHLKAQLGLEGPLPGWHILINCASSVLLGVRLATGRLCPRARVAVVAKKDQTERVQGGTACVFKGLVLKSTLYYFDDRHQRSKDM